VVLVVVLKGEGRRKGNEPIICCTPDKKMKWEGEKERERGRETSQILWRFSGRVNNNHISVEAPAKCPQVRLCDAMENRSRHLRNGWIFSFLILTCP
jgi:hypothetical protein